MRDLCWIRIQSTTGGGLNGSGLDPDCVECGLSVNGINVLV